MNPVSSTSAFSQTQVSSSASRAQSAGQSPANRLDESLSAFLTEKGVSTEDQTAIKSELSDAITSLVSAGTAVSPTEVKAALSEILSDRGLDGEGFVSQLGTPGSGGGQGSSSREQGGQRVGGGRRGGGGGGPRGAGGPPPGGRPGAADESTETTSTSETSEIDDLLAWLESQTSESESYSGSKTTTHTLPGSFIKRGGGNLDATV